MENSEQPAATGPPTPGDPGETEDLSSSRGIVSINDYIAGAIGGSAGIIVGHPFDTTKIQMQIRTTGDHKLGKTSEAWTSVAAQGMKRGMFRGLLFPVCSYGAVNSIFFGVYGNVVKLLEPDENTRPSHSKVYLAGCIAGTAQLVLACPTEVIKCTMQSQIPVTRRKQVKAPIHVARTALPTGYYSGPIECIKDIFRNEGIRGFYKGCFVMFFRDVPSYGLYLLVYEYMFAFMVRHELTDQHHALAAIVAGGLAGSVCWASIMPFDVIKSRIQVDHSNRYRGFIDCAVKSVRGAGISVLFRGTGITVARAFPVNAITFLFYSQILKFLNNVNPR